MAAKKTAKTRFGDFFLPWSEDAKEKMRPTQPVRRNVLVTKDMVKRPTLETDLNAANVMLNTPLALREEDVTPDKSLEEYLWRVLGPPIDRKSKRKFAMRHSKRPVEVMPRGALMSKGPKRITPRSKDPRKGEPT